MENSLRKARQGPQSPQRAYNPLPNSIIEGPAQVEKNVDLFADSGNRDRYSSAHSNVRLSARSVLTIAHTLPPKPAPNADAATAPNSRAMRVSAIVSGT